MQDHFKQLRQEIQQIRGDLRQVETELTKGRADSELVVAQLESLVGPLMRQIQDLDGQIEGYRSGIERVRNRTIYGESYEPIEEQYRRTWTPSEPAVSRPSSVNVGGDSREIRRLYRDLARRLHPDHASGPADRAIRTERMTALNSAYAAGSLAEMMAMWDEMQEAGSGDDGSSEEMVSVLERHLAHLKQRLARSRNELDQLHESSAVKLSLRIKLARRDGRDLLAEMAADLEKEIEEKKIQRDLLKRQYDALV